MNDDDDTIDARLRREGMGARARGREGVALAHERRERASKSSSGWRARRAVEGQGQAQRRAADVSDPASGGEVLMRGDAARIRNPKPPYELLRHAFRVAMEVH